MNYFDESSWLIAQPYGASRTAQETLKLAADFEEVLRKSPQDYGNEDYNYGMQIVNALLHLACQKEQHEAKNQVRDLSYAY